ncbi:transcriptional regulator with XRE-family HTH domain [Lipingzhangella halophila]|uniref:Transcriptional regulator with XRE-family HTH domain n=1 Tax=Lipingzhangella halophila TaxID=1783352 RepID=A0A7W7W249_9ACTN|nr:helix-turn-helix transcriptional regulator [Lipingzhangella halophila]MBB4930404.1 transcriptional regulator with XRE-family HTH domain [Lipingzhangella halophila]
MTRAERVPVSDEHRDLGRLLRDARASAGATTRDVALYSSGHISNVENGHVMPSTELVYYYVKEFGCDGHVARQALDRARRASEERRRTQRLVQRSQGQRWGAFHVTPDSPASEIREGYKVRESEAYYRVDERGVITEVDVIRVIRAVQPGVSLISVAHNYHYDAEVGVLSLEPGIGCSLAALRETGFGYLYAVLRLDRELNPDDGDAYSLSYRVHVSSSVPARPLLRYQARAGNDRYALRVLFTPPVLPQEVWWFSERDVFATEMPAPAQSERIFPANPSGFYFRDFTRIDNLHTGIAWRW